MFFFEVAKRIKATNTNSKWTDAYRRPGFNCESIINVNCYFSPKAQLLQHNYYYQMIDSVHVTHVLTLLCSWDQKMSILRYLKPVTGTCNNLPTPDDAGLSASISKEINQSVESAIAGNRRASDNDAKDKYDRQICS